MFTGMLESVADVHQLTVILGHEMAHALLGHSVSTETCAPSSSQRHLHVIYRDPRADFVESSYFNIQRQRPRRNLTG